MVSIKSSAILILEQKRPAVDSNYFNHTGWGGKTELSLTLPPVSIRGRGKRKSAGTLLSAPALLVQMEIGAIYPSPAVSRR
jgi:hypothetical protein